MHRTAAAVRKKWTEQAARVVDDLKRFDP